MGCTLPQARQRLRTAPNNTQRPALRRFRRPHVHKAHQNRTRNFITVSSPFAGDPEKADNLKNNSHQNSHQQNWPPATRGQFAYNSFIILVPGGGVEPPRGCPRRILSPYLLQTLDLWLYYLQQLTGRDGEVLCGPVRGYFGSLGIVWGIDNRNDSRRTCLCPKHPPNQDFAASLLDLTRYGPDGGQLFG